MQNAVEPFDEALENCRVEFISETQVSAFNVGHPPLDLGSKPVSFFEFWPAWVFYTPVVIYWFFLSLRYRSFGLPMAVNPNIPLGGMIGESKAGILRQAGDVANARILPFVVRQPSKGAMLHKCDDFIRRQAHNDISFAGEHAIELPFIVKPDLGCRGTGVSLVSTDDELVRYLKQFPVDREYLIQKLAPYEAEAGVFYERIPGDARGHVTSMTLKYRPVLVGDGERTVEQLILRDDRAAKLRALYLEKNRHRLSQVPAKGEEIAIAFAGSHCRGSIFRNGNEFITEALSQEIDRVMQDFPEFHYGRLDIKFKEMASFQRGEDFVIIEVNAVSSEKTHIWDSRTGLFEAYRTLFEQYGTLFKMGKKMQRRGYKVPSALTLVRSWLHELRRKDKYPSTT